MPALIVVFPLTFLAIIVLYVEGVSLGLSGVVIAGGLHVLVIHLVRDQGRAAQRKLWKDWGGAPTTLKLRWHESDNQYLQKRLHQAIGSATGVRLPTMMEQTADPNKADSFYETATAVLREQTREKTSYPLVYRELTDYGFRRNLYGCRGWGILCAAASVVIEVALFALSINEIVDFSAIYFWVTVTISIFSLTIFLTIISSHFVWKAGERYAEALFGAALDYRS